MKKEHFGWMEDGREISLYTLDNGTVSAAFTDLGAVWVGMMVPDRDGNMADVLLGYDDAEGYLVNGPHFGSVVGRVANRTGNASFVLNGVRYSLGKNKGEHNLHSGPDYYDRRLWSVREAGDDSLVFFLESPDGDQGFPGNLKLSVRYTLTRDHMVEICYVAVSDQDTPLNVTNHAYFNLGGHNAGSVLDTRVQIFASHFTPTDADSIPTGEILPVEGTPMDFRLPKAIGKDIGSDYIQVVQAKGFDHNWCLDHIPGVFDLAATACDEASGRAMDVYTDRSGVQFYTGNWLNGEKGKGGASYADRDAFCFETQFYPDAVNHPDFPCPVLKAGVTHITKTGYRFWVKAKEIHG